MYGMACSKDTAMVTADAWFNSQVKEDENWSMKLSTCQNSENKAKSINLI
jgi:hypothetical protein